MPYCQNGKRVTVSKCSRWPLHCTYRTCTVHDSMLAFSELVPYSAAPEALEFNINPRLLILIRRVSLLPLVYLPPWAYFNLHNYSMVNLWLKKWRLSADLLIKISLATAVSLYCLIFCCCGFWQVHFRLA